ncbi:MAG: TonB-dependent siderophore receptor [Acidobacteria bacterium]|nr:TonB-dependent siderophore receptor [Acidobacteriota bacterium]
MSISSEAFHGGLIRTLAAVLWLGTAALAATPAPAPPPPEEITGTLQDMAGGGVPNARVSALLPGRSQGVTTVTGASGTFTISLPVGQYELVVRADGFEELRTPLTVSGGPAVAPLRFVLQLAGQRQVIEVTESMNYQAVVSSAIKAPTPLQDVPQAISVVSRDLIRDQSMQSMADVVRYVPGITMAQGEGHRDAPVIRGNATTSDFYVNGVRDDVQYYRDLYNVERVEAVKGANAMTFGRGGGGGVINRVTKQADFQPLRELSLQGGSFGNRRFSADAGHNFGDRVAIRINGVYENSNSFRHEANVERYGVAPSLTLQLGGRTQLRAGYEYFHDQRTVDRGIPSLAGAPSPAHRSTFFGNPHDSRARAAVHLGSLTLEHQAGQWNLRNATLAGDYDKFYSNVFPGALNANTMQVSLSGYDNGTVRRNLFNQTDATTTVSAWGIRHTLLLGSEFGRQRSTNLRQTAYFNGNATSVLVPFSGPLYRTPAAFRQSASDAHNTPHVNVAAIYMQDQMEFGRHLQLVAGLRYDFFDMDFRNLRNNEQLESRDHMVSPRLGVVVKPIAPLSLYGSYSVAYLPNSGDQFASLTATSRTLKPERFNNYETGAKVEVNRRLSLTAALYRLDRTNTTARDPNNPALIVQTGSQRTNGFELGVNGNLTSKWMIVGGYAKQDAFISSATTAAGLGAKVAIVPGDNLSLWNHYRLLPRVSVGLGLIRQGSMFAGIDNLVKLPGFTRADGGVFFDVTERVRLQANVENFTNTRYYPTAHSNNNIMPGSPAAARIGLVARF